MAVRWVEHALRLDFDDEWSNENAGGAKRPGSLTLHGARVLEGNCSDAMAAWVSEISMTPEALVFDFCDAPRLIVRIETAVWEATS